MESSTHYVYQAQLVFIEVTQGIYTVFKSKYVNGYKPGSFIGTTDLISALNLVEKVAIVNNKHNLIYSNFTLEGKDN